MSPAWMDTSLSCESCFMSFLTRKSKFWKTEFGRFWHRSVHVINPDIRKIAGYDPASLLFVWKVVIITFCLFIWCQQFSAGLRLLLIQFMNGPFLFDQDFNIWNIAVNIAGMNFPISFR